MRGLAFSADGREAAIGICPMYPRDRKRLRPLPWYRQLQEQWFPFSGILIADARTWRVKRRFRVEAAEPYEILCVDPPPATR